MCRVRQSGLEPEYRLHGSAFQEHRVCLYTTGALTRFLMVIVAYYYCKNKAKFRDLLKLTDFSYYSKLIED
jgi:hypothetical protein